MCRCVRAICRSVSVEQAWPFRPGAEPFLAPFLLAGLRMRALCELPCHVHVCGAGGAATRAVCGWRCSHLLQPHLWPGNDRGHQGRHSPEGHAAEEAAGPQVQLVRSACNPLWLQQGKAADRPCAPMRISPSNSSVLQTMQTVTARLTRYRILIDQFIFS